jgi:transcriptional antiterminator RfaH
VGASGEERVFPYLDDVQPWYVLRTKRLKERVVERRLASLRVSFFSPRIMERVRINGRIEQRLAPMFPSYVFVQLDLARMGKSVRYAPGARDFLRFEEAPQPVPPEIVRRLRERMGAAGVYTPPPIRFQPGERLMIEAGPLRGLEVIFERELSGIERVAVLLAEVGLSARVVLPSMDLSKTG